MNDNQWLQDIFDIVAFSGRFYNSIPVIHLFRLQERILKSFTNSGDFPENWNKNEPLEALASRAEIVMRDLMDFYITDFDSRPVDKWSKSLIPEMKKRGLC